MYPYNDLTMSSWTERACGDAYLGEDLLTIRQMHQIKQKQNTEQEWDDFPLDPATGGSYSTKKS